MPALFECPPFVVRALHAEQVPALQSLFDANPQYFNLVAGQPPRPNEAQIVFDDRPPTHLTFTNRWFAGVYDRSQVLKGLLVLLSDLSAQGVWHIALFFLDASVRGTGAAKDLHTALEAFAAAAGARWLRLGVIVGNQPAERFWSKCGYEEVRTRSIVNVSGDTRISRVMIKPLPGGTRAAYLDLVPRDRLDSPLP